MTKITQLLTQENKIQTKPRPYINHSVEFKRPTSVKERTIALEKAGLNVFFYPAELISGCDFLSDSGTTTMTNEQWASLHYGDESYGSNKGYFLLGKQIKRLFGEEFFSNKKTPNAFMFHQGRAAEDVLFTFLSRAGSNLIIPSNGHFDTTAANIEANNIKAMNLFSPNLKKKTGKFKGDMDVGALKSLLKKSKKQIPLIYLTITNNTGGGQPVSMANIAEVSQIAHAHKIPLFLDACRFAENAWFIKTKELGFKNKTISEIVKQMFSYADGFTISFKKDGLANMGGGLFLRENGLFVKRYPKLPDMIMNYQILTEGHPTYGGMTGRNIMTLVSGLKTVTEEHYLSHRISQVKKFGDFFKERKLPIIEPTGGHAIYLDINKFFSDTSMKPEDFGGISLTALLLAGYGHRACELGYFAFGSYDAKTKKHTFPKVNFIRFAVPRLRYELQDLEHAAESMKLLYEQRKKIPGVKVVRGLDLPLRHFKAKFNFK